MCQWRNARTCLLGRTGEIPRRSDRSVSRQIQRLNLAVFAAKRSDEPEGADSPS
ncbi:Uncharacterised protein [Mycobacteroides abscessus subsp. massiliense]|nr:Uncharacterised protein [Mycobacteroides abscessus subsp. massiliense]